MSTFISLLISMNMAFGICIYIFSSSTGRMRLKECKWSSSFHNVNSRLELTVLPWDGLKLKSHDTVSGLGASWYFLPFTAQTHNTSCTIYPALCSPQKEGSAASDENFPENTFFTVLLNFNQNKLSELDTVIYHETHSGYGSHLNMYFSYVTCNTT